MPRWRNKAAASPENYRRGPAAAVPHAPPFYVGGCTTPATLVPDAPKEIFAACQAFSGPERFRTRPPPEGSELSTRTGVRAKAADVLQFPREGPQMLVAWLILTTLFVAWLAGGFPRVTRRAH